MKVLFLGTPSFGVPVLQALAARHTVVGVVTRQDKRNARGRGVDAPVKAAALQLGLPLFQPPHIRDQLDELEALGADLWVTAAYGQILNERALAIPPYGVWNVHASLLPRYRGASPVQCALLAGESEVGVTIMRTVRQVDAGDILASASYPLNGQENAGQVLEALAPLGAKLLLACIDAAEHDTLSGTPQDDARATFCPLLSKEEGHLHFDEASARDVVNRVRAFTPSPSAYFIGPHGRVKVFAAKECEGSGTPGSVLVAKGEWVIACKQGAVSLLEVQGENARRMSAADYLRGKSVPVGTVLQ